MASAASGSPEESQKHTPKCSTKGVAITAELTDIVLSRGLKAASVAKYLSGGNYAPNSERQGVGRDTEEPRSLLCDVMGLVSGSCSALI